MAALPVLDFGLQTSACGLYSPAVSKKSSHIAQRIEAFQGRELDAHYVGYFDCFNRQLFYEAHDVLEELWLADRHGPNGAFYKGLIQLAGAFVHLQKQRLRPAAALFKLAQANLEKYPGHHEQLDLGRAIRLINHWRGELEARDYGVNPLRQDNAPSLRLEN
jgi:predicted metal-dependent hydrolase